MFIELSVKNGDKFYPCLVNTDNIVEILPINFIPEWKARYPWANSSILFKEDPCQDIDGKLYSFREDYHELKKLLKDGG